VEIRTALDVPQSLNQVWAFSSDPMAQKKWDRSVAEVELTSPAPFGLGSTFRTIGPSRRGRPGIVTSYRVATFDAPTHARIEVADAKTLRRAVWKFWFSAQVDGTHIEWSIELVAKRRFVFLAPVLRLNRAQLVRDMHWFKDALDEQFPL
jgi:hypothetical protein